MRSANPIKPGPYSKHVYPPRPQFQNSDSVWGFAPQPFSPHRLSKSTFSPRVTPEEHGAGTPETSIGDNQRESALQRFNQTRFNQVKSTSNVG